MENTDFIVNKETINETLKKNEEFLIQNTEKWCKMICSRTPML